MTCEHTNFDATVNINRIVDGLNLTLAVSVSARCKDCGAVVQFSEGRTEATIPATIEDQPA